MKNAQIHEGGRGSAWLSEKVRECLSYLIKAVMLSNQIKRQKHSRWGLEMGSWKSC